MSKRRWWIQYTSMWTGAEKIASFDTYEEAEWFCKQVNGRFLDWK